MTENGSKWTESQRESGENPLKLTKIGFGDFAWKVGPKNIESVGILLGSFFASKFLACPEASSEVLKTHPLQQAQE